MQTEDIRDIEQPESDCEAENPDYEKKREVNIKQNRAMLNELLAELKKIPGFLPVKGDSPKKLTKSKRSFPYEMVEKRRNPSRNARPNPVVSPPQTRSSSKRKREELGRENDPDFSPKGKKFFIKFGPSLFKSKRKVKGDDDEDEEEWEFDEEKLDLPKRKQSRVSVYKSADEITDADLDMVANTVADKEYDSVENWVCPPCRGVCNCSFCRKKSGRHATGILVHLARQSGYDNVMAYLNSFKA
ncbi:cell division cycle-associated 7-like protein isoform X2 [Ptychodera flava]|uniref:cell division cycle-associated 7-like protein isoform X2 n=1 Tax=Ptychodera flava TaxID=63121 RepID=UPI003969EAFE